MASGEIIFIQGESKGRFPDANSLFVDDEIPAVIDPATKVNFLQDLARRKNVEIVFNSHYHVDHIRYNKIFEGALFAAHSLDAPAIESLEENARFVGIESMPWFPQWKKVMRDVWGYRETKVGRLLKDMDEINLGQNTLRIIHAPGHTPGHICIEFIEQQAVYLADVDLTSFGPWYGNVRSSVDEFLGTIERLKNVRAETWYTGHESGVLKGDIRGRLEKYAEVIRSREEAILNALDSPKTLKEISNLLIIYKKPFDQPMILEFFEGMMVSKHLERLKRAGMVKEVDGRWVRV